MKLDILPYSLTDNDELTLSENFIMVHSDIKLSSLTKKEVKEFIDDSLGDIAGSKIGVYFWLVDIDNKLFKIYVGKTNSFERRLNDYIIDFQIHSPNDYKMRFFYDFVVKNFETAKFCLFFRACQIENYTKIETECINEYEPLINKRASVDKKTKEGIKKAFCDYYEAVFISKLNT